MLEKETLKTRLKCPLQIPNLCGNACTLLPSVSPTGRSHGLPSPDVCLSFPPVTPRSSLLTQTPLLSLVAHTLLPGGGAVTALPGPPASLFLVTCDEPVVLRARCWVPCCTHRSLFSPLAAPSWGCSMSPCLSAQETRDVNCLPRATQRSQFQNSWLC